MLSVRHEMKTIVMTVFSISLAACTAYQPLRPSQETQGKKTRVWSDSLATYYDTDGDGRPDEWHRGNRIYYDTNRDGQVDMAVEAMTFDGPGPMVDSDEDGYFDSWQSGQGLESMAIRIPVPRFPSPQNP